MVFVLFGCSSVQFERELEKTQNCATRWNSMIPVVVMQMKIQNEKSSVEIPIERTIFWNSLITWTVAFTVILSMGGWTLNWNICTKAEDVLRLGIQLTSPMKSKSHVLAWVTMAIWLSEARVPRPIYRSLKERYFVEK